MGTLEPHDINTKLIIEDEQGGGGWGLTLRCAAGYGLLNPPQGSTREQTEIRDYPGRKAWQGHGRHATVRGQQKGILNDCGVHIDNFGVDLDCYHGRANSAGVNVEPARRHTGISPCTLQIDYVVTISEHRQYVIS